MHCLPEWKELIAVRKKTMVFQKGRTIFSEGDPVLGIYFINSGVIKVSASWGPDKELIHRFARQGDILGHRGIGGDQLYPISATVIIEAKVCFIDNNFLESTLRVNNDFTNRLLHVYATELHKAEKKMRDLAHRDVKGRIVQVLAELSETFGTTHDNFISLPLSRQDFASYAGTTYETVFKTLNELGQSGLISTEGKNIRVNDMDRLKDLLNK